MAQYTVTVTFGTPANNACSPVVFDSLEMALANVRRAFEDSYPSPVMSVTIEPGDYAPKLVNGEWVWPVRGEG